MNKIILFFKTHFKKSAIATMFLFAMVFWLVFLTGCNSNLFGAYVEETSKTNISQMIQNEPVALSDTNTTTIYKMKNENGIKTDNINSGKIVSMFYYSAYGKGAVEGKDIMSVFSDENITGNVMLAPSYLFDNGQSNDELTYSYGIVKISNVSVDWNYLKSQDNSKNTIESDSFVNYSVYGIVDFGELNESTLSFADTVEYLHNKNICESFDYIMTDYTWYKADFTAPEIGGTTHISVNVDFQPSVDEIISHVYANDETDGSVPVVVESSTYIQGEMKLGDFVINISATDTSSNKSTSKIDVHKYDSTGPVINGTDTYDLNYDNDLTLEKIESALTITDNIDTGLTLEKVSDTFSGNEHKLGDYQVVYRTIDLSNNYSANKTINLSVKNKGTAVISGAREIKVGTDQVLTLEEFKAHVSVVDGYDGTITNYTIEGFDDYTATSKVTGRSIVKVSYTNSGNNTATADFIIDKLDKIGPTILFDDYFILLRQGETFTLDMIKNQVAMVMNLSLEDIESISGDYDTSTLGDYDISVDLKSGESKKLKLSVVDELGNAAEKKSSFDNFFSTEGYVENLLKPTNWTIYHYLTILGIVLVIAGIILIVITYKNKKDNFDYPEDIHY